MLDLFSLNIRKEKSLSKSLNLGTVLKQSSPPKKSKSIFIKISAEAYFGLENRYQKADVERFV